MQAKVGQGGTNNQQLPGTGGGWMVYDYEQFEKKKEHGLVWLGFFWGG